MKAAVIGSRGLSVDDLEKYLPAEIDEIVTGGAKGIDASAAMYARTHSIELTEYLPDYKRYGRCAPLKRNILIVENADIVYAFWDGMSHGTKYVIDYCHKHGIPIKIIRNGGRQAPAPY